MRKLWLNNEIVDRLAMLQQTEVGHPGVNQVAIEKDWWVTVTLKALFQTDCRDSLIFKGGTSLSKGFGIIERFLKTLTWQSVIHSLVLRRLVKVSVRNYARCHELIFMRPFRLN